LKYSSYGASPTLGDSRFGYTGQVWIASLGLYYYKARFYSPRSGRFIQPDLIHSGDGLNRYAYADNDPINGKDPTGDDCEDGASGPCDTVVVSHSPPSPEGPVLPEITPLVIPQVVVSTQSSEVCQSMGYMFCLRTTPEMGSVLADQQGEYAALGTSLIGGEFTVETLFARVARLVKLGKIAKTPARAKTVINKNVAKLQSPPVPTGWTQGKFGSQLVRWGQGPEGAAARLRSLTPEDVARMQADGLTREIAQQWRDFYANDLLRNASNVTAGPRIELLDAIIKLMN
jgi:RHS repeat-associated protein